MCNAPCDGLASDRRPPAAGRPGWRAVVVLLLLTTQCGHKTMVRAPEDCAPETITDLAVRNDADGIRLSWMRPKQYVDGKRMDDLGHFVIERSTGDAANTPFERLATLEVTDRERFRKTGRFRYLDAAVTTGVRYRYRVVSFTLDGYVSAPSNIASIERGPAGEETHAPLPTP
jgi:hypothetical protein